MELFAAFQSSIDALIAVATLQPQRILSHRDGINEGYFPLMLFKSNCIICIIISVAHYVWNSII